MNNKKARKIVQEMLDPAGVTLDGGKPWDIRIRDERIYERILAGGSLEVGDSYVDAWWEVDRLDELFDRVFRAGLYSAFAGGFRYRLQRLAAALFNRQDLTRSRVVAEKHYNLGNDIFSAMLDRRMNYTCAYWESARDLDEAQEAKLELVCRKLDLKPGMKVLELGCGWGAFAKYAAEHYGVSVVGYNIAQEQVALARALCQGLPVEFRVQDYRLARGAYDRVVSIGLFEHLGPKNHRAYMERVADCLKDDGSAFVHTIAQNTSQHCCDPWFDKHIFPNSVTPSLRQLGTSMEGLFVLEDCHNIGPHYDPTLLAWYGNLERAWPSLQPKYGYRLFRKFKYYLLASAAVFRSRQSQVFQLIFTKTGRRQPACRPAPPQSAVERAQTSSPLLPAPAAAEALP